MRPADGTRSCAIRVWSRDTRQIDKLGDLRLSPSSVRFVLPFLIRLTSQEATMRDTMLFVGKEGRKEGKKEGSAGNLLHAFVAAGLS